MRPRRALALLIGLAVLAPVAPARAAGLPDPLARPKAFADPPAAARPKTRWWWADPYDNKEFAAEVDAFAAAGFGGAEIAYNTGSWATEGQRAALKTALETARRDGLRLDMTLGASWPVMTPATANGTGLSEQELQYGRQDVAGAYAGPVPMPYDDPANSKGAKLVAVTAAKVLSEGTPVLQPVPAPNTISPPQAPAVSPVLDPASLVDLSDQASGGSVTFTAPDGGHWIVFGWWQRDSGENVVDHLSPAAARAVADFLDANQIGAAAAALLPGAARDFFEDSLELDVQELLWTPRLREEFKARRGYDVTKYLPLLPVQGEQHYPVPQAPPHPDYDLPGGLGDRVRHDYYETVGDLYSQAHMKVFQEWAKTHSMRYRTQPAFGNAFDVTRAARDVVSYGGIADDESLNAGDPDPLGANNWRFALDHYRTLMGGVHQAGGREASTELGAMFFRDQEAGLDLYKALMDKQWAAGIAQPIIHGFSYQPLGSGWPGRDNFSGIVAQSWNQRSFPQWPMFRPLNDYWARGNMVLQQGRPQIDVAIYQDRFVTTAATFHALATDALNYQVDPATGLHVFVDDEGDQRIDDGAALRPRPFFATAALERAGYTLEYVDPLGLVDARAGDGAALFPAGPGYRALVIDQRALPAASAEAIARHAEKGLAVVFVGTLPDRGTSAAGAQTEDARVRAAVQRILHGAATARVESQGRVADALQDLAIEPAARWSQALPVYSQHRAGKRADYWYLWNAGASAVTFTPAFAVSGAPSQLDLWTGEIAPVALWREAGERIELPTTLGPGETRVLAFERSATAPPHVTATDAEAVVVRGRSAELRDTAGGERKVTLSDGRRRTAALPGLPQPIAPSAWKLHVDEVGPDGVTPHDLTLDALADWRDIPELSGASGTGTYTTTVTLPADWVAPDRGAYLELGSVGGALQASVNARRVAPDVTAQRRFDVSALLHAGSNELTVVVTTTLKNKLVSLGRSGDPAGALYLVQPATQPYGLMGPVRLVPFARARVQLPRAARACASRRRIAIHLRRPVGFRVRSATVRVRGHLRRVRAVRAGRRLEVLADLRRLPRGTVRVRVTVRGTRGRVLRTTRTYRLCRPAAARSMRDGPS